MIEVWTKSRVDGAWYEFAKVSNCDSLEQVRDYFAAAYPTSLWAARWAAQS